MADAEAADAKDGCEDKSVVDTAEKEKKKNRLFGGLFLGGITAISMSSGFGYAIALAKKKDTDFFTKGLLGSKGIPESGGAVAMRALGLGTLYAFSGVGLFCFLTWKLLGVHSMDEFSAKMKSFTPEVPKNKEPGRSDFKTVREVFEYIISEDEKAKKSSSP